MYSIIRLITKIKTYIYKVVHYSLFDGVILYDTPTIVKHKNVYIGAGTRINGNVYLHGAGKIRIGENVTLSYGTTILSTGYDTKNWHTNKTLKGHVNQAVTVGDNVWLGANVTVLPGVDIAEGIIVAAGSVVNKDLDSSNALYAGVPAKKIKNL
ncbi:acyltransferase [Vibrio satsumensis]|uniref:acyltransferase n=1 Tax=Vibrio satsumensis TaxID=2910245 RepID=UPI003D0D8636